MCPPVQVVTNRSPRYINHTTSMDFSSDSATISPFQPIRSHTRKEVSMPAISVIAAALSSIKAATDIAKLIKESTTSLEQAEVKLRLAELVSALADAKIEIAQIQEVLLEKDGRIKDLQESLDVRQRLAWEQPYYWLDVKGVKEGPYCQQCYDNGRKLIRLQSNGNGTWSCRTCQNNYRDKTFTQPGPSRAITDHNQLE